jgi:hypothetical protein
LLLDDRNETGEALLGVGGVPFVGREVAPRLDEALDDEGREVGIDVARAEEEPPERVCEIAWLLGPERRAALLRDVANDRS